MTDHIAFWADFWAINTEDTMDTPADPSDDIATLLSVIDRLQSGTGRGLDPDDAALVEVIRDAWIKPEAAGRSA